MRTVLINPAFFDTSDFKNRYTDYLDWIKGGNLYIAPFEPPLGLAYLSAYLKKHGEDVAAIDMQGLMMDTAELGKRLSELKPDLVGITSMTTTFPAALKAARLVKEILPSAKVVFGGVHPTLDPRGALEYSDVDYVIRGEGELSLYRLVKALRGEDNVGGISGLCYKENGEIVIKERSEILEADTVPAPDYEAFPIQEYIKHNEYLRGIRGISMLVSRGCPFGCTFCAVQQTMGRKWRVKSPELLVNEIIALRDAYGIEGVWFKDSIFNMNKRWTTDFANLMIERQAGVKFQINTRVDLVNEEEIKLLVKAGLTQIDFGVESGSDRILKRLKKETRTELIKESIAIAHKYVKVFGFFMVGIPGETEEDIYKTFELAKELELDSSTWSIYSPLPGSPLYDELLEEGRIERSNFEYESVHFTKAYEGVCDVPAKRVSELYNEINDYFYKNKVTTAA